MPSRCRYCKARFEARNSLDKFCSYKHAMAWLATPEGAEKHKKVKAKLNRDKKRESNLKRRNLNRQTLGWQHKKTQMAFNKMRRMEEFLWFKERGLEPECVSCGKTKMDWACGHFKSVGSSGGLRYNRANTFLQCNRYCNRGKSGNIEGCKNTRGYKQGLIDRFGVNVGGAILEYLEKEQYKAAKWTCEQLEEMRKGFNQRIRELEAQL